jgi:hypothetical protein
MTGWQGDETAILASGAASVALTYGIAMVGLFISNLLDERQHAELTAGFGDSIEKLPPRANTWIEFGLHYAALAKQYRRNGSSCDAQIASY